MMGKKGEAVRQTIIETADEVIYRRGYHQASFAELAEATGIPKGNFYYYFKSKDELLQAVIDHRLAAIEQMLQQWRQDYPGPRARLKRYLQIPFIESDQVMAYGCPMGSLTMELGKCDKPGQQYAARLFDCFRAFLTEQFEALGYPPDEADAQALHLITWVQGIAVIGSVYKDSQQLQQEIARAEHWLDALEGP